MTYCLAMRLKEGLVFLADTRTNAGVDNVGTYRKQHVFAPGPRRLFVIESAGNLATTQEVLDRIRRDLATPGLDQGLASVNYLFEAALYIGRLSREVVAEHRDALTGVDGPPHSSSVARSKTRNRRFCSSIPRAITSARPTSCRSCRSAKRSTASSCWRWPRSDVDAETATKIALGSMMSTARANLSVGPPYDLGLYARDSFKAEEFRIEADSPVLVALQDNLGTAMHASFAELPSFTREDLIPISDSGSRDG